MSDVQMTKLYIERVGQTSIAINLWSQLYGKAWKTEFVRKYEHEYWRDLDFQELHTALYDLMEAIRRQAYEQGYKDGRGHRARQQYFYRDCRMHETR